VTGASDVGGDRSSRLRIYRSLRSAHLERLAAMVPARMLYTGTRYDFDEALVDPSEPPVLVGRFGVLRELLRRHHDVVEVTEPAMITRAGFLLVQLLAVRARDLVDRRRTMIVTYCIGNADPALEVRARWHLPLPVARVAVTALVRILVRLTDRLAFGTTGSRQLYEDLVGPGRLEGRARTFEALPSACPCGVDAADGASGPTRRVLFLGAFAERKGIGPTLAAWDVLRAEDREAELLLVGTGPLESEVRRWAADRAEVSVLLDPPRPEVHRALRASDVLVLLSQRRGHWREQIGLPVLEGLAHGCEIVVTTETGLAPWLADHGHEVLPPTAAAAEVAAAIEAALDRARTRTGSLDALPDEDQRIVADRWLMTGEV
jgi:glycosyltransferase involved in cell wall biosynthesis